MKHITLFLAVLLSFHVLAQNIPTKDASQKEIKAYLKSIDATTLLFIEGGHYISYKSKKTKKWGLLDAGKIIVKPYYDSVGALDNECPYFIVKKENKYGIIPSFYKSNASCKYDKVSIKKEKNGYYGLVCLKNLWGLYIPELDFQPVGFEYSIKENVPLFDLEESMHKYMLSAKTNHGAVSFLIDQKNGDGVFIAKNKSNKWGMFQMEKLIVAMVHDSLGFYGVNASNSIVKNEGKYGLISSPWGENTAEIIVACDHDMLKYVADFSGMVASKRGNKWAYINSSNGDTLIPYVYNSYSELPKATINFIKHPMPVYPQKLLDIMLDPASIEHIDLRGLGLTSLPKEVMLCVNAKSANLENNDFTSLPDGFFELLKLEKLYLGGNTNFDDIGNNFSKLLNLRELYIGTLSGSGVYAVNSGLTLHFDESLSQLTKLEKLSIDGQFVGNDLPAFIYKLPSLIELRVTSSSISQAFLPAFEKLKSKQTLEILQLGNLVNFNSFNQYIGTFPNLKSISIETTNERTQPKGILNVKDLKYFKAIVWVKKSDSSSYSGITVMNLSSGWGGWQSAPFTKTEKMESLAEWSKYMKTIK